MRLFPHYIEWDLKRLTLTGTGSVLVGSTTSRGGQSELVQLVDEQFINVVRLVLRNPIPHDDADDQESGCTTAEEQIKYSWLISPFHSLDTHTLKSAL